MVSSQARVAASGLVIPVGVATGTGEAVTVSCAGKPVEKLTSATRKITRRRGIPRFLRDCTGVGSLFQIDAFLSVRHRRWIGCPVRRCWTNAAVSAAQIKIDVRVGGAVARNA